MDKSQSPSESPKNFDHPISKESLERHLAALDAISNAVVANNTQDNIGFRSNSSFLIEDILFPRPKVRKNYLLFQKFDMAGMWSWVNAEEGSLKEKQIKLYDELWSSG